jgi:hypothetical protein
MSFLSSSYFTPHERPSFFEIVAQDRMIPGLKFASRYVVEVRKLKIKKRFFHKDLKE